MNTLGNVPEKCGSDLLVGGVLLQVDRDEELLSLGINVTDINTTLVREENPVTLCCCMLATVRYC